MTDNSKVQLRLEYETLKKQLDDPQVYQRKDYPKIAKRFKELTAIVHLLDQKQNLQKQKKQAQDLSDNPDQALATLAKSEVEQINHQISEINEKLNQLTASGQEQNDSRDCLVEIRAGVGGSEASLFAADLYRMYLRFSEKQNWRLELMSQNPSEIGGFKEIIFEIRGRNVYKSLKFESGVHRVQRVPTTESQGRIHTSTASVAVLPKTEPEELEIQTNDLRIDTYRSSGHGGQSVNKTDSAVRITHLPSGIIVTCQDEKSQFKNKEKAFSVLRARLSQKKREAEAEMVSSQRQKLIGRASRNEKIRTYNFPQDRLTDHRINFSLSNLPSILNGSLQPLIEKLNHHYKQDDNES